MFPSTTSTVSTETKRKFSKRDIEHLGRVAVDCINAGKTEVAGLYRRWERLESLYKNVPEPRGDFPFPKASSFHYPLIQTKVDALTSHVCTTLSRIKPYFTALAGGVQGTRNHVVEQVVHYFWELAGYEHKLRILTRLSAIFGKSILYVGYKESAQGFLADNDNPQVSYDIGARSYAGLDLKVIHPRDFIIFPNASGYIQQAKLVGHRFLRRRSEIRDLIKAGRYEATGVQEDKLSSATTFEGSLELQPFDRMEHSHPPDPKDELVELWQVILRERLPGDEYERYYLLTIEPLSSTVLSVEEYPFPRPWYFSIQFHQEYGRFWNSTSVAQNLQGIQVALNAIYNAVIDGAYMGIAPPVFAAGSGIGPQKSVSYTPGEIVFLDGTFQPVPMKSTYDPSGLLAVANKLELAADLAARISNLAQATPLAGEQTATEVMRVWSGQQVGLAEYVQVLSLGLAEAAAFSLLLLRLYMDGGAGYVTETLTEGDMMEADVAPSSLLGWYTMHAAQLPATLTPQDLWAPVRFEVHGKSVAGAPEQRMAAAIGFAQVASSNPIFAQMVNWVQLLKTIAQELQLPNGESLVQEPMMPGMAPGMAPGVVPEAASGMAPDVSAMAPPLGDQISSSLTGQVPSV